ncbi:MAG: magnesium/cobalt transporter CorA [Saprospiraceae bacterium]|nr:magnesium/cobalt transporter CorA [Saprospiraceae bacterium]
MLFTVYKTATGLSTTTELEQLALTDAAQVVWIDLFNTAPDERDLIEAKFNIELFTRQEAEEIESSSKYFENGDEINANSTYIFHRDGLYANDPVSFILKGNLLVTQRNIELRSFDEVIRSFRLGKRPHINGYHIFLLLFETRIDIEADFLEDLSRKIHAASKSLTLSKRLDQDVLIEINQLQELIILFRQSTSEMQRLISALLKSDIFPHDEREKLRVIIKDAGSLLEHTSFNFARLESLQNTFLGLVDMEQNRIIKIFTVATVVFMPPTLIASLYGMNFQFMPELKWHIGYPFALFLMVLSSTSTLLYFKRRNWL